MPGNSDTPTLDHAGIIVRDLDEAARFVERLGFTLTRRAEHAGTASGRGAGSAQRSMMFERGYIELQQLADVGGDHPTAPAARRFFGLHILAFGIGDARGAHAAMAARDLALGPVMEWSRRLDEPDLSGEARFAFFVGAYGAQDDSFLCWTQHLTPEVLRAPRLVAHANGARRLAGVVVATDGDCDALAARYIRCGGTAGAAPAGVDALVTFADGTIEIIGRTSLPAPIASTSWPAAAWLAAPVIAVRDLAAFARHIAAAGCATVMAGPRLYADTRAALGCWLAAEEDGPT